MKPGFLLHWGSMADLIMQHDNIVKYIGFVKSIDCLNIILE